VTEPLDDLVGLGLLEHAVVSTGSTDADGTTDGDGSTDGDPDA
jgi:hypothetical protein